MKNRADETFDFKESNQSEQVTSLDKNKRILKI